MNTTPFVFITDNGYVVPTVVSISSLIKNQREDSHPTICVVYSDLSADNMRYLKECGGNRATIELVHFDATSYSEYSSDRVYVTPTSLIKFELANIFKSHHRIVYLDGDVIVRKDITHLLDTNIDDFYCAAVQDFESSIMDLSPQRLKLNSYFNSGVMVLNLDKIREDNLSLLMFSIKKERKDLFYMDQDVLNISFQGKVKVLPMKYNYIKNSFLNGKFGISKINDFFGSNYSSIEQMEADVAILHLAGAEKPWKTKSAFSFDEWYSYYFKSPISIIPLSLSNSENKDTKSRFIKRILKRTPTINSNGYYEVKLQLLGITIMSKVRTKKCLKFYLGGIIKVKELQYS